MSLRSLGKTPTPVRSETRSCPILSDPVLIRSGPRPDPVPGYTQDDHRQMDHFKPNETVKKPFGLEMFRPALETTLSGSKSEPRNLAFSYDCSRRIYKETTLMGPNITTVKIPRNTTRKRAGPSVTQSRDMFKSNDTRSQNNSSFKRNPRNSTVNREEAVVSLAPRKRQEIDRQLRSPRPFRTPNLSQKGVNEPEVFQFSEIDTRDEGRKSVESQTEIGLMSPPVCSPTQVKAPENVTTTTSRSLLSSVQEKKIYTKRMPYSVQNKREHSNKIVAGKRSKSSLDVGKRSMVNERELSSYRRHSAEGFQLKQSESQTSHESVRSVTSTTGKRERLPSGK